MDTFNFSIVTTLTFGFRILENMGHWLHRYLYTNFVVVEHSQ
jgi:hypothetical protein